MTNRLRSADAVAPIIVAASLLACGNLAANGIIRDSIGAVSSGRGGANVAHDDNLSLILDNPAGLAWGEPGYMIEVGNDILVDDVRYRDADDSDHSSDFFFNLPNISFAARMEKLPVTFGVTAALPGGYGARYKMQHDVYGNRTYRSEGMLLKLLPTVAYRLGEHVSIGGGVGVALSKAKFRLPYTFNSGAFTGQSALVDLKTDGAGITGNIGIQIRATERWTIGAAFTTQSLTEQKGDFDVDITGSPLAGLFTDTTASYDADMSLRWPRSASLGTAYRFDFGRLSLEGIWFDWSAAFDELHINLSDGDNAEFDAVAGAEPTEVFPLGWRDSYSIRAGYEAFVSENGVFRLGYIFNMNPIPNRTLTPLLPGTLEHTMSIGYGHAFGRWNTNVAYQYAWGRTQKVGTSELAGDDFDSSTLRAQAHWLFVSVATRF